MKDASGAIVSELRYDPWGEVRYSSGTTPTDYTFTGQYSNTSDFGLMFYNARWMDPSLGRFTSADSLVELDDYGSGISLRLTASYAENGLLYSNNSLSALAAYQEPVQTPISAQAFDRYSYARNNPIRYNDPSGHCLGVFAGPIEWTACGAAASAGPVGWAAAGGFTVIEVVVIGALALGAGYGLAALVDSASEPRITYAEARGRSGGAASAARHLAMLLRQGDVAGFAPHPGEPDPDGRDQNTNVKGLKADLQNLLRNLERTGKTLDEYLAEDWHWSARQIQSFKTDLSKYVSDDLPVHVNAGRVSSSNASGLEQIYSDVIGFGGGR